VYKFKKIDILNFIKLKFQRFVQILLHIYIYIYTHIKYLYICIYKFTQLFILKRNKTFCIENFANKIFLYSVTSILFRLFNFIIF